MEIQLIKKGHFGGQCKRTQCTRENATWFNYCTQSYYCGTCAKEINRVNRDFAMKTYGHDMCRQHTTCPNPTKDMLFPPLVDRFDVQQEEEAA